MKNFLITFLILSSYTSIGHCQPGEIQDPTKNAAQFNFIYNLKNDTFDIFSKEPNAFLVKIVAGMKPGTALDVAMGEGRNTVFLAQKGWQTTGFDVSEDGLRIANMKAENAGVKINTIQKSWQEFDFGRDKWDLVLLSYAWVPLTDSSVINKIYLSLKKGGIVIIEHPLDSPSDIASNPTNGVNAILKSFLNFHILFFEDTQDISDWRRNRDNRQTSKFRTLRLIGSKY